MDNSAANTDLIRGHVITIILRSLQDNDKYGYEICREIEVKSEGSYVLKQPTLYSCLKRLESQGYITSYQGEISNGGKRRYYSLTEKGAEYLEKDKQEWEFSRTLINRLLSDKDYDLTQPPPFNPSELRPYTRKLNEVQNVEEQPTKSNVDLTITEDVSPVQQEPVTVELIEEEKIEPVVTVENIPIVEPIEEVETVEVEETLSPIVEEDEHAPKSSFSIFDLMDIADSETEEEEQEVQVDDEDEKVTQYVVPTTYDTVDEDDLKPIEEEQPDEDDEESEAAKIIADAYDPYYGESYSDTVDTETAYTKLFTNNNSTNEFFGIKEEDEEESKEEEQEEVKPLLEDVEPISYEEPEIEDVQEVEQSPAPELFEDVSYEEEESTTNDLSYKNAFSKLFNSEPEEVKKEEPVKVAEKEIPINRDTTAVPSISDLKKRYYTEGYNLKSYNRSNVAIYYNMNYVYANKLNLFAYWIMYAIILFEIGLTFLIDGGRAISSAAYIVSILVALVIPGVPTVMFIRNPLKRIKAEFDLKRSFINRGLLALNLALISVCLGLFFGGVVFNDFATFVVPIFLPIIYLLNFPLSSFVYYMLYQTKKFHLK